MVRYLKNLSSEKVHEGNPWEVVVQADRSLTKAEMIRWANTPSTDHCFYGTFEGESAGLRVSKTNEVYQCHGIVADYDAQISPAMLEEALTNIGVDNQPNHSCFTFSNGVRLVWLFEEPVTIGGNPMATAFMKVVMKEMRLKKILPGLDEPALLSPTTYYERGNEWRTRSLDKITPAETWRWVGMAGDSMKWKDGACPHIPLETLQERIELEYPGKWEGEFVLGARCRRFWDADASNDTAAVLRESGFQCFTGPKSFVGWGELLGHAFVKKYDADRIGKVLENIFYDDATGKFWYLDGKKNWVSDNTTGISRLLRVDHALEGRLPKGHTASEVDRAITQIQKYRRVASALPYVHFRPGLLRMNGKQYLNTSQVECVKPAEKSVGKWGEQFPFLGMYLQDYFINPEQLRIFLAWWKRVYAGGLNHKPVLGHALYFVGPQNCGKTLMNQRVIGASLGGAADARSFLVEGSQFGGSCLDYPILSLDDSTSAADRKTYLKYSALIKAMVANPRVEYNQKYKAAGQITWLGRILVSLNDDAQSLQMIPDLEQSLLDKIMLFKIGKLSFEFPEQYELEATIESELPLLLRWLLDWDPPSSIMGDPRFGVHAYQHPDLRREAQESDQTSSFLDILSLFLDEYATVNKDHTYWKGSVGALLSDMSNCERVQGVAREYTSRAVGMHLRALSTRPDLGIERITTRRKNFGHVWKLAYDQMHATE